MTFKMIKRPQNRCSVDERPAEHAEFTAKPPLNTQYNLRGGEARLRQLEGHVCTVKVPLCANSLMVKAKTRNNYTVTATQNAQFFVAIFQNSGKDKTPAQNAQFFV